VSATHEVAMYRPIGGWVLTRYNSSAVQFVCSDECRLQVIRDENERVKNERAKL
jgi:hypothetical protein